MASSSEQLFECLVAADGDRVITEMRLSDGFFNATKMCQSGNTRFFNYSRCSKNRNYLMSVEMDLSVAELERLKNELIPNDGQLNERTPTGIICTEDSQDVDEFPHCNNSSLFAWPPYRV